MFAADKVANPEKAGRTEIEKPMNSIQFKLLEVCSLC